MFDETLKENTCDYYRIYPTDLIQDLIIYNAMIYVSVCISISTVWHQLAETIKCLSWVLCRNSCAIVSWFSSSMKTV